MCTCCLVGEVGEGVKHFSSTKKWALIRSVHFYPASVSLRPYDFSRFLSHILLLLQKLQSLNWMEKQQRCTGRLNRRQEKAKEDLGENSESGIFPELACLEGLLASLCQVWAKYLANLALDSDRY